MTPANRTRLQKAGEELLRLSRQNINAQDIALALLRTEELVRTVLLDVILRPEVNSE